MNLAVPFISHVEKQITVEQAQEIAKILGLPMEISFLSLSIDENLRLTAFARGLSADKPFHYNSVPFNWLSYEPLTPSVGTIPNNPPAPVEDKLVIVPDTLSLLPNDTQPIDAPILSIIMDDNR